MSNAVLGEMREISSYDDHDSLNDYLASQMLRGSLAIVLGAGASFGFGLPNWDDLIAKLYSAAGREQPSQLNNELAAESLLRAAYRDDRLAFASAVRDALYLEADLSLESLRKNDLLAAIGALTMASSRGSVAKVVSFNYDDLVERYLSYYGHDVSSIDRMPDWNVRSDVQILHPHGYLASDGQPPRSPIVLTQADYDAVVGNHRDPWRLSLLEIFSSHTCVFIGLSGNDKNLTSVLTETKGRHASTRSHDLYWGVRFALGTDSLNEMWAARGVYNRTVSDYKAIPSVLFDICQRAATRRRGHLR